jgi:cysteinyl-tRNA synthetase
VMNLFLHDTMSGEKRRFVPTDPARVTMYVCGPTVYSYPHVGNGRAAVVFDLLFRVLRRLYGEAAVIYSRNITDVDDKINKAAMDAGLPISAITDRFIAVYNADMDALGVLRPTLEPRATGHIEAIQTLIARLIERQAAYAPKGEEKGEGHVLFSIEAFPDYGKLSGRSLDDMIAGARVEVAPYKRHPADFVMWKPSKPGEPVWDSPWGPGRPGWHIECSAMIEESLGLPIDIHGGGHDLIFPHHENEIAQSLGADEARCADHAPVYANYWVHNGFLTMDSEKMSKSLGNGVLVHELVKQYPGEVIRWALLVGHYRGPLDWTADLIDQARTSLDRQYQVLRDVGQWRHEAKIRLPQPDPKLVAGLLEPFWAALCDDLNTPSAMSHLFALANRVRGLLKTQAGDDERIRDLADTLAALLEAGNFLGFLEADPDAWFEGGADTALKTRVEALLQTRFEARQAKDWGVADKIRDELNALNVVVMDGPDGATWRLAEKPVEAP